MDLDVLQPGEHLDGQESPLPVRDSRTSGRQTRVHSPRGPRDCPRTIPRTIRRTEMGYADELFDLTDRVVLVTGGSRGLGREMAFAAARCGADVIIASRKYETCVETAKEIEAATGR